MLFVLHIVVIVFVVIYLKSPDTQLYLVVAIVFHAEDAVLIVVVLRLLDTLLYWVEERMVVHLAVVTVLVATYLRLLDTQLHWVEVVTLLPAEMTVLTVVVTSVSFLEGAHDF